MKFYVVAEIYTLNKCTYYKLIEPLPELSPFNKLRSNMVYGVYKNPESNDLIGTDYESIVTDWIANNLVHYKVKFKSTEFGFNKISIFGKFYQSLIEYSEAELIEKVRSGKIYLFNYELLRGKLRERSKNTKISIKDSYYVRDTYESMEKKACILPSYFNLNSFLYACIGHKLDNTVVTIYVSRIPYLKLQLIGANISNIPYTDISIAYSGSGSYLNIAIDCDILIFGRFMYGLLGGLHCERLRIIGDIDATPTLSVDSMFEGFSGEMITDKLHILHSKSLLSAERMYFEYIGNTVDISNLRLHNLLNAEGMFSRCGAKEVLGLKNQVFSSLVNANSMFCNCIMRRINLSRMTGNNLDTAQKMFSGVCLEQLNLSNFTCKKLRCSDFMFADCKITGSNGLDLSMFIGRILSAHSMFCGVKVYILNISNMDVQHIKYADSLFKEAFIQCGLDLSRFRFLSLSREVSKEMFKGFNGAYLNKPIFL